MCRYELPIAIVQRAADTTCREPALRVRPASELLSRLRGMHHATFIFTGDAISLGRPGGVSGELGKMPLHEERSAQVLVGRLPGEPGDSHTLRPEWTDSRV